MEIHKERVVEYSYGFVWENQGGDDNYIDEDNEAGEDGP